MGSEVLDHSCKQALCSKLEQLVMNLASSHAALIQNVQSVFATDWLTSLTDNKDYDRAMLNQYHQAEEGRKRTSLGSCIFADDKDPSAETTKTLKRTSRSLPGILIHTELEINLILPNHDHREGNRSTKWSWKNYALRKKKNKCYESGSWRWSRSARKYNYVVNKKKNYV